MILSSSPILFSISGRYVKKSPELKVGDLMETAAVAAARSDGAAKMRAQKCWPPRAAQLCKDVPAPTTISGENIPTGTSVVMWRN